MHSHTSVSTPPPPPNLHLSLTCDPWHLLQPLCLFTFFTFSHSFISASLHPSPFCRISTFCLNSYKSSGGWGGGTSVGFYSLLYWKHFRCCMMLTASAHNMWTKVSSWTWKEGHLCLLCSCLYSLKWLFRSCFDMTTIQTAESMSKSNQHVILKRNQSSWVCCFSVIVLSQTNRAHLVPGRPVVRVTNSAHHPPISLGDLDLEHVCRHWRLQWATADMISTSWCSVGCTMRHHIV